MEEKKLIFEEEQSQPYSVGGNARNKNGFTRGNNFFENVLMAVGLPVKYKNMALIIILIICASATFFLINQRNAVPKGATYTCKDPELQNILPKETYDILPPCQ